MQPPRVKQTTTENVELLVFQSEIDCVLGDDDGGRPDKGLKRRSGPAAASHYYSTATDREFEGVCLIIHRERGREEEALVAIVPLCFFSDSKW